MYDWKHTPRDLRKLARSNSVKNKVCNSLEVVRSCEFDDDSTLLSAFRDGDARVVGIRQRGYDTLPQGRQWSLLAGARTRGGLRLSEADDLFGGAHREPFRDDAFCEPFHFLGCRK